MITILTVDATGTVLFIAWPPVPCARCHRASAICAQVFVREPAPHQETLCIPCERAVGLAVGSFEEVPYASR